MTSPEPPPQRPDASPSDAAAVRIEVCDKHGLRYNAAVDDGCARCRTEAGARSVGRRDFSTRRAPDLHRGLLVAGALVLAVGGGLFVAHTVAYNAGKLMVDSLMEEAPDEEPEEDAMSEAESEEAFERLFGEGDDEDND